MEKIYIRHRISLKSEEAWKQASSLTLCETAVVAIDFVIAIFSLKMYSSTL